jgi:hypothetical protein
MNVPRIVVQNISLAPLSAFSTGENLSMSGRFTFNANLVSKSFRDTFARSVSYGGLGDSALIESGGSAMESSEGGSALA